MAPTPCLPYHDGIVRMYMVQSSSLARLSGGFYAFFDFMFVLPALHDAITNNILLRPLHHLGKHGELEQNSAHPHSS